MELKEGLKLSYKAFLGEQNSSESNANNQCHCDIHIFRPEFLSRNTDYLLEIDREIKSNISFNYLLLLPTMSSYEECLIIGHGLNEASYVKLFPWAYCLSKELQVPVIVLPQAFHINRRPTAWQRMMRSAYRARKDVPGNNRESPFNAVISQRLSEAPERFFRGSLQSYADMLDLIQEIVRGKMQVFLDGKSARPFKEGTKIHFLGYSITGYLFLTLLLTSKENTLASSRCILFSTCARPEEINPISILVIDHDAFIRTQEFYRNLVKTGASRELLRWYNETEVGLWFQRLLVDSDGNYLPIEARNLSERLMIIADPKDPIFPLESIIKNFGNEIPISTLDLGRHEFPFNIKTLENRKLGLIASEIRKSYAPSSAYLPSFLRWLDLACSFLGDRVGGDLGPSKSQGIGHLEPPTYLSQYL